MVTTHKIPAELYDESFELIALHSSLGSYAVAYAINELTGLQLKRSVRDLDIGHSAFPIFTSEDMVNERYFTLMGNVVRKLEKNSTPNLFFEDSTETTYHLVQERKEVDYFLKVEAEDRGIVNGLLSKINAAPKIVAAYTIDVKKLKSKRNLIF